MLADRVKIGSNGDNFLSKLPGHKKLIAGDWGAGFFGEVSPYSFITGNALTNLCGITEGDSFNSTTNWLKFAIDKKVIYTTKLPIRNSISWSHLDNAGCVFGEKIVRIGEVHYKVRLFKTSTTSSYDSNYPERMHNSEWNRLMLPIHIQAKTQNWTCANNVKAPTDYWETDYTNNDLGFIQFNNGGTYYTGRGCRTWCQEGWGSNAHLYKSTRGASSAYTQGVACGQMVRKDSTTSTEGWRPVLEPIK